MYPKKLAICLYFLCSPPLLIQKILNHHFMRQAYLLFTSQTAYLQSSEVQQISPNHIQDPKIFSFSRFVSFFLEGRRGVIIFREGSVSQTSKHVSCENDPPTS